MSGSSVRVACEQDLRDIVAIEHESSIDIYPSRNLNITKEDIESLGFGEERLQKYRERYLRNDMSKSWMACLGDKVVGFTIALKGVELSSLEKLYILPEFQNRRVGNLLLKSAFDWLAADRIRVYVASHNSKAIDFYTKNGFRESGKLPVESSVLPTGRICPISIMIKGSL